MISCHYSIQYGQNEETEILCKSHWRLRAGSAVQPVSISDPKSVWLIFQCLSWWHGNTSRTLSPTSHNKIIQRIECSGDWRGITITLFCHHNGRKSRLRLKINKVRTSVIALSSTSQGQLTRPTDPYLRIQNIPTAKIWILWDRTELCLINPAKILWNLCWSYFSWL